LGSERWFTTICDKKTWKAIAHPSDGIADRLAVAEIRRSAERPTNDLTAYDLYLRALSYLYSWDKEGTIAALDLLRQAIERDPHFGPALALAAASHSYLHVNGWTNDLQANRREGVDLAQQALRVAGEHPVVLGQAAHVLGYFGEDIDAAIDLIDRALELNPSYAVGWNRSGWLRLWAGQPELAIKHFERSLRLNPHARRAQTLMAIGAGHFFAHRLEDARTMLLRSLQENPTWVPTRRFLASCHAHMGRLDEVREMVKKLRGMTAVVVPSADHWRNPEHREFYLKGLHLAAGEAI
jgi:adenylate cyclase